MIPNPIHKVLSTLSSHQVRYLLMGGQACVLYGATEFSRDCDVVVLCDAENLDRLRDALRMLAAEPIAVPPFTPENLERGHAIHFRCRAADVDGIRIDVMAKLRGVDPFADLWTRRTTFDDGAGDRIELMGLPDLVAAKKTQRDKDWPMLRRLIEAHYAQHKYSATPEQIRFWLLESRTPELLIDTADAHRELAIQTSAVRPLVAVAIAADREKLEMALADEEAAERTADRAYWEPLKRELEQMRQQRRRST